MIYGTPNIVTDGLVLQLDAANTKSYVSGSTTWNDLSGRNNSGSLSNTGYNSYNGGAITFPGNIASRVTITNTPTNLTFGTGDFSVECWFNTNGTSQTSAAGLIGIGGAGSSVNWLLGFNDLNALAFFYNGAVNQPTTYVASTPGWIQAISVRTGVTLRIYINGVLNASLTSGAGQNYSDSGVVKLGINRNSNVAYNGSISTARIYNKALTAAEVAQNYNALKARFGLS